MARLLASIFVVAFSLLPSLLQAGSDEPEPVVARREFRQSNVYPYVFEPVSYLVTGGPKAMRFAQAETECAHRDAPALPIATPTPTPESKMPPGGPEPDAAAPVAKPAPVAVEPTPIAPAFPPPANAQAAGRPDLSKMPDEVMNYFKNPYSGPRGPHLFDPIFEPGYHEGPASKATYQETDKP